MCFVCRLAQPPVGLEASYPPYSYPPGALALLEEQLYLERCGMLRPPLYPPLAPAYLPYMLPSHLAFMHERLKLEEEQRQRLAREEEREKEQRERELLQQQREREQREKEKREREKAAAAAAVHHPRMSPHVLSPHHAIQSQMMLPMMMPSPMLHPSSLRQSPMGLQSIQRQSPALVHPSSSFHSVPTVPRSSPSLQRHSPSVFHPITSQYSTSGFYSVPNSAQKHSPASTPSSYPPTPSSYSASSVTASATHVVTSSYVSKPHHMVSGDSANPPPSTINDDKPTTEMSAGEGIRDNGNVEPIA